MDLPNKADVVIIGGGVIGTAIAYYLTQKGCKDVVVLERNQMLGLESTGKNAGGVRAQFGTKVNIQFALESIKIFEKFEELTGQDPYFSQCGYLFMTENEKLWKSFQENVKLQNSLGVDSVTLTPEEIKEKVPLVDVEGLLGGTFWQRDGILDPSAILVGYEKRSIQAGVKFVNNTEVTGFEMTDGKIDSIVTDKGKIKPQTVVLASGAWSKKIGKMLDLDFPAIPIKRQIVTTKPLGIPEGFPMVVNMDSGSYLHRESGGILMGWADPNTKEGLGIEPDFDYTMEVVERSMARLPIIEEAEILSDWAGLYSITPDHHAILGKIEKMPQIVCAFGFSGHGVMHAPAVGICLAEEIFDGKPTFLEMDSLRFERFEKGELVEEKNVI